MSKILEIALSQYGVTEHTGGENPIILNYAIDTGIADIKNDEISWCSIFINWCCLKAGLEMSKSPAARSWLQVGESVDKPNIGDIVVLWRESRESWKGHVGIFISYSEEKNFIYILGGNQGNRVCIQSFSVSQILSFRKLKEV